MLKIDPKIVAGIRAATEKEQLYRYLQNAIELEHSTIPPYLTSYFSVKPGANVAIAQRLRQIVIQEMLHMTIAANILVAVGGSPQINNPAFIPSYPGKLPMGIGGDDFIVPIAGFSKALVKDVFMVIEEPENPIPIKVAALAAEPEFSTIGEFYSALKSKISDLGDGIFVVESDKQVLSWFDKEVMFPITDADSAGRAIDVIVLEGEGTSSSPFESPGDPAHYYKFGEIYNGREVIKTDDGFAYGGAPIPFDESGVYPIKANAALADYPPGSKALILAERYAYSYSSLLNALHESFNGAPEKVDAAIGLMYELKLQAHDLMSSELLDGSGMTVGPVYAYVNTQGGVS